MNEILSIILENVPYYKSELTGESNQIINSCISCHSTNEPLIPQIPFHNSKLLSKELTKTEFPRGTLLNEIHYRILTDSHEQMPRGIILKQEEKNQLLEYFNSL